MGGVCLLCWRGSCRVGDEEESSGEEDEVICEEEEREWGEFFGEEEQQQRKRGGRRGMVRRFVVEEILGVKWGEKWREVRICGDCMMTGVRKAWRMKREMEELEREYGEVKEDLKEVMRERRERARRRKSKKGRGRRDRVIEEVARLALERKERNVIEIERKSKRKRVEEKTRKNVIGEVVDNNENKSQQVKLEDNLMATATNDDTMDEVASPEDFNAGRDLDLDVPEDADEIQNDHDFDPGQSDTNISSSDSEYVPETTVRPKRKHIKRPQKQSQKLAASRISKKCRRNKRRCDRCGYWNKDPDLLPGHMALHAENDAKGDLAINCPKCGFPCRTPLELEQHNHTRHFKPSRISQKSCTLCSFKTKIYKTLRLHMRTAHPNATEEQLGPEVLFKCIICNHESDNPRSFRRHVLRCRDSALPSENSTATCTPMSCPTCGILFDTPDKLQFHIITIHKRNSQFCCDVCGKGFMQRRHLQHHLRTHNPQKRDFVCEICGMDYRYEYSLSWHYKKCHPNGPPDPTLPVSAADTPFKCRYCSLTSAYKAVILRHLKTHKEEMGNRCELCGKCYINPQGLRRHMIINHPATDEVYKCQYCFREYSNQNALNGHLKHHCSIKKLQEQQQSQQQDLPQPPSPQLDLLNS